MAVGAVPSAARMAANGTHSSSEPIELAIDLPRSLGTRVNVHLTLLANAALLFLSSSSAESGSSAAAMGSFVYAMPDVSSLPLSRVVFACPRRSY